MSNRLLLALLCCSVSWGQVDTLRGRSLILGPTGPPVPFSGWSERLTMAIRHSYVPADTTLVLRVPVTDATLLGVLRSDCHDLAFAAADGSTQLSHLIRTCTPANGLVEAYVYIPVASASVDTPIVIYGGNAAASDQQNPTGVWDANYKGVWLGGSLSDATANANNLTLTAGTLATGTGKIGAAFALDGQTGFTATAPTGAAFTAQQIVRASQWPTIGNTFLMAAGSGVNQWIMGWDMPFSICTDGLWIVRASCAQAHAQLQRGQEWHVLTATWDGATGKYYVDGGLSGSFADAGSAFASGPLYLFSNSGGNYFQGKAEDIRYSNIARSASQIYPEATALVHPEYILSWGTTQPNTNRAPVVDQWVPNYIQVESGQPVRLRWLISNFPTSVSIDQGVGSQANLTAGEVSVSPTSTTTYTISASNSNGSASLAVTVVVLSGTAVYLHDSRPAGTVLCGFDGSTPVVMKACMPQYIQPGDYIYQDGLAANDPPNNNMSNLQGVFRVKTVIDATHYTVTNLAGTDMTASAAYSSGQNPLAPNASIAFATRVAPYTMAPAPRLASGGRDAYATQRFTTIPSSLVCVAGSCTVTLGFNHGVQVGQKISVWGTNAASGDLNANATGAGCTGQCDHAATAVTATTITFATTSPDGTYTSNNVCGPAPGDVTTIGGTENCVRVSLWGIYDNPAWRQLLQQAAPVINGTASTYKHRFDGGSRGNGDSFTDAFGQAALYFLLDLRCQNCVTGLRYFGNNQERISAVNWIAYEGAGNAGTNQADGNFQRGNMEAIGQTYTASKEFFTSGELTAYRAKFLNDFNRPFAGGETPCRKVAPLQQTISTNTARGGSSTSIQLAAAEGSTDYTGTYIVWADSTNTYWGRADTYNTSTQTATVGYVTQWDNTTFSQVTGTTWGTPTGSTAYKIYAGISLSGTTVTGHGTHFTTWLAVGDAIDAQFGNLTDPTDRKHNWIVGPDNWSMVSAITDDTHLTVILGSAHVMTSTSIPMVYFHKWNPDNQDCGYNSLVNHWEGASGSQSSQYGATGGYETNDSFGGPVRDQNNGPIRELGMMVAAAAMIDEDARAARILEQAQTYYADWSVPYSWGMWAGSTENGTNYGWGNNLVEVYQMMDTSNLFANFVPPQPPASFWSPVATLKQFSVLPDQPFYSTLHPQGLLPKLVWGGNNSNQVFPHTLMAADWGVFLFPTSPASEHLRFFLNTLGWPLARDTMYQFLLLYPPYAPMSDNTTQPLQYFFTNTQQANCWGATGHPDCLGHGEDMMFSRSKGSGAWTDKSATQVMFQARAFDGHYDNPSAGSLSIYKAGWLANWDSINPAGESGWGGISSPTIDPTIVGDTVQFNGAFSFSPAPGQSTQQAVANITRWAGGGNFAGDSQSRYACAMADLASAYRPVYNRVQRWVCHLKKPGTEELVFERDDIDTSNAPTTSGIRAQLHFPQTGEAPVSNPGTDLNPFYQEGTSTCNSCAATNPTGYVLSQEDGHASDANGPARTNGVIAKVFSPNTITTVYETAGSYTGSNGHADRWSIWAGPSAGASATSLDDVVAIKVSASMGDNTLTAAALNPDANWTGVQTTDKVAMFNRGGVLRNSLTVTTTHAGTAQYLVAGLAAGTYNVTVNSGPLITGATVADGDNTLYFETTAGLVVISTGTPPPPPSTPGIPLVSSGMRFDGFSVPPTPPPPPIPSGILGGQTKIGGQTVVH